MIPALDILILISTAVSAWFWWKASGRRLRRIEVDEEIDSHDLNRIIVSINRSQILNARAALATALSAGLVAVRFLVIVVQNYF